MKQSVISHITKVSFVLALLLILIWLSPRSDNSFKYYFEIGKPWGYELMTAEFDFPIYKTDRQIEDEQMEVIREFAPIYRSDRAIVESQLSALADSSKVLSQKSRELVVTRLRRIYDEGIMSAADKDRLVEQSTANISIMSEGHQSLLVSLGSVHSPATAYSLLQNELHEHAPEVLHRIDIANFVVPNLTYDSVMSKRLLDAMIDNISPTEGMVQEGEKIIDRGEVVTAETYQILVSLSKAYDEQQLRQRRGIYSTVGEVVVMMFYLAMLLLYLLVFRPNLYEQKRNILFFCMLIAIEACLTFVVVRFTSLSIYVVPYIWVPVLVRVFYDSRTALYMHILTVLLMSLYMAAPYEFIVLQMGVGMLAVGSLKDISQRAQLARTAVYIFLAYSVLYTAQTVISAGTILTIDPWMYVYFAINGLLVIGAYGLVYIIERTFGFVSSITLVELSNVNSGLMLELAEKAPGTFQHSIQVSTLATEAAKSIGANTLLIRAGALYHDIGKLIDPACFTENQQDGVNPLNELDCIEAAQKVISHVLYGVELARKHHLPKIVTNFILTHHGTGKVRYFYNSWVNQHPGESVDEQKFTYPGPRPTTKETGILMMADAVEARSRSLTEYTPQAISDMVEQMIKMQMDDRQFELSPLTLNDVEKIKQVFKDKLISMNHHRISYPEIKK